MNLKQKDFIATIKFDHVLRAEKIREIKIIISALSKSFIKEELDLVPGLQSKLVTMRYEFRHYHIARCEMRGRKREEIESPNTRNKPDETFIAKIKKNWYKQLEALSADQKRLDEESASCTIVPRSGSIPA